MTEAGRINGQRYHDVIVKKATLEQKIENLQMQLQRGSQTTRHINSSSVGGDGDILTPGSLVSDVLMNVSMGHDKVRWSIVCSTALIVF